MHFIIHHYTLLMHRPLCGVYASKFLCILMHYSTVPMHLAPYAILYVHCFMLCYAFLCMHMYHLIYVILSNSALVRFYAFHMCGFVRTTHHAFIVVLRLTLCISMHFYRMHMWHLPYAHLCISVGRHCHEWLMHGYARLGELCNEM